MTAARKILRIAVPRPIYTLLDYLCPEDVNAQIGCRVRVPLGNSISTGIVVEQADKSECKKLRKIKEMLDEEPLIAAQALKLLYWASQYYHHPIGDVIFNAIPSSLRKGKSLPLVNKWVINPEMSDQADALLMRAYRQRELWDFMREYPDQGGINEAILASHFDDDMTNWRSLMRQLEQKNLVIKRQVRASYQTNKVSETIAKEIQLTEEQQQTLEQLRTFYQEKTRKPVLLHGITGSGKTEVYLRTIELILAQNQQVLVLVPEIGLTPQLLTRFQQYFPDNVIATIHSALSDGERTLVWLAAKKGEINIIIGTRSAVFAPLPQLGMIIVDEEHDSSFKQQEGFRYHGRDLAVKRAVDANIPIILGSATPALESLQNVDRQRYHYLRLSQRPGFSQRPEIQLLDTRGVHLEAALSQWLLEAIQQHTDAGNQVMLFLNRRGFAPVLFCQSCGWHKVCSACDANMTYHASRRKVICHHCGYEELVGSTCPDCGSDKITTQGQGTERIQHVLESHFPEIPVVRIDRDTTSRKGSLDSKLAIVREGKPVILIGTQMLTKGHDFPKLTLVGILDVDQSLFSMDYRAQEYLAQQIVQVSGRAGRGEQKGYVVLQTAQPEHPLLTGLLSNGYLNIARQLLSERKQWNYPPFAYQALIRVSARDKNKGLEFLRCVSTELSAQLGQLAELNLLGPVPSPMEKRADRYHSQLLINATKRGLLHHFLTQLIVQLQGNTTSGSIRWSVDVDPLNLL